MIFEVIEMTEWLTANLGTIIVSVVLIAIVSLIISDMVKKKKQGKTSCGCGCANCAMKGACHKS